MLANMVKETTTSPGTGTSVSLNGAVAGYIGFSVGIGTGQSCFYFLSDGTQTEAQSGTVTAGTPLTLTRGTPIWTSTGSPSRLNFTGTVSVFCAQPAQRTLWADASSVWQAQSRRLAGLAAATSNTDAPTVQQVAWRYISEIVVGSPTAALAFSLPAGFRRYRVEWQDLAPSVSASLFARVSTDGGSTYKSGAADYAYARAALRAASVVSTGGTIAQIPLSDNTSGTSVMHGSLEFSLATKLGSFECSGYATAGLERMVGTLVVAAVGAPTHILLGYVLTNVASGNARLLGAI